MGRHRKRDWGGTRSSRFGRFGKTDREEGAVGWFRR